MQLPEIVSPTFHVKTAAPKPKKPDPKVEDGDIQYLTDRNNGRVVKTPDGSHFFYLSALSGQGYNNGVYVESGVRGKRFRLKKDSLPKFLSHIIFSLRESGDDSKEYKTFISSLSQALGSESNPGENQIHQYIKKLIFEFIETQYLPKSVMSFYGDNAGIAFNDALRKPFNPKIEMSDVHLALFKHNFKNLNKGFANSFPNIFKLTTTRLAPWLDRILLDLFEELKLGVDASAKEGATPPETNPLQKIGGTPLPAAPKLVGAPSNSLVSPQDQKIRDILQILVRNHIIEEGSLDSQIVEGYLRGELPIDKVEEVTGGFRVQNEGSYPKLVAATINVKRAFAAFSKGTLETHPYDTDLDGQLLPDLINWVLKNLKEHDKELQEIYNAKHVDPKSRSAQALIHYFIQNKQAPFNTMPGIDEAQIFYNEEEDLEVIIPNSPDDREGLLDDILTRAHNDYISLRS